MEWKEREDQNTEWMNEYMDHWIQTKLSTALNTCNNVHLQSYKESSAVYSKWDDNLLEI